ncbi:MAG: PIN domain-containing protein [candidate division NC10 bacterium]|nr:PIN domain-containing protein [candidate division NC10 bacterium]
MIYCLDTDVLIEYFRGNEAMRRRVESLQDGDELALTWFSCFEFFKGVFWTGRREDEELLRDLVEAVRILEESYDSARIGGQIYADLRRKGKLINDADIFIASVAKAHGAILVTNNEEHFSRIEGLPIENWTRNGAG